MKQFLIISALVLSICTHAYAQTETASKVWITPSDAKAGEAVTINALVYNDTVSDVNMTVVFFSGVDPDATELGKATILVKTNASNTAAQSWTMPSIATPVAVAVSKAVATKTKKTVPSLAGVVGTITVGGSSSGFSVASLKDVKWIGTIITYLEDFRTTQAQKYEDTLANSKKEIAGIAARKDRKSVV